MTYRNVCNLINFYADDIKICVYREICALRKYGALLHSKNKFRHDYALASMVLPRSEAVRELGMLFNVGLI